MLTATAILFLVAFNFDAEISLAQAWVPEVHRIVFDDAGSRASGADARERCSTLLSLKYQL